MAGVFPTAGSPTGATSPIPPPTAGTGDYPSVSFSNDYVKLRFFEPNAPKAINQRWIGMPRGVYIGFTPSTTPSSKVLTLEVDPTQNFSLLKVPSKYATSIMVDIFTASAVEFDFAAHTVWPVYVIATSVYDDKIPTQGKIFTRATSANGVDEVTICKVDLVDGDLVVGTSVPDQRHPPIAFQSQSYGFMQEGSIGSLESADATVAEVIAARNSALTSPSSSLKARIDEDMSGSSMADRLGLRLVSVVSNLHPNKSGSSFNVSASFTETGRNIGPSLTIEPNGSETVEGAITDGVRNYCFVVDATNGNRIVDTVSDEPVFGKLSYTFASLGAGKEIQFVNASSDVSGNGTNPFSAPLQEGDLIQGADGLFYELESIVDPDNAILGAAYQGADSSQFFAAYRRWTLLLFTVSGGPYTISSSTNIRFTFPCFFRTDRAIFDGSLFIKQNGERPVLPLATDSTYGRSTLAIDGGLVGSLKTVRDAGTLVGTDIHTLNFAFGGATVNPLLPGVVDVSVIGETGPPGPDSDVGPQGPTGPAGFGYSVNNPFEVGPEIGPTVLAGGTVSVSFTFDWTTGSPALTDLGSRSYAHVNGGFSKINGFSGLERVRISDIAAVSNTESRIDYSIIPNPWLSNTTIQCYQGASQ